MELKGKDLGNLNQLPVNLGEIRVVGALESQPINQLTLRANDSTSLFLCLKFLTEAMLQKTVRQDRKEGVKTCWATCPHPS